jgi:hypothetical protein
MEVLYMKKQMSILKFEILSTVFIMILGTLLHFTFAWSNNNLFVGTFSAVNESTWEHLKLLFFPMLITTIIGYFYTKSSVCNYLCAKVQGILVSISFIIIFFYTYTGIIGTNFAILDIASFFIAVILGEYLSYKKMKSKTHCNNWIPIIILSVLCLCFIIFTFFAPHIGLFKDPVTGMFGITNVNL